MIRSSILLALTFTTLLAANARAVPARTAAPGQNPAASYQVKKGDSLYAISRQTGLSVKELKRLNGLQGDALKPGQILSLAKSAVSAGGKATAGNSIVSSTYKVKKGDSLYAIARRNGLSVAELKRFNGLKNDAIRPGQKLLLARTEGTSPSPAIATGPDPAKQLRQESAAPPNIEPTSLEDGLEALEEVAFSYLATPYRFGGSSHQGIDCSSFVRNVFRELNIDLPRTAREQYRLGASIAPADLQSGDLLFFRTYAKYPSHVGIYLGDHKMIHASPRSRRVVIANVDTPYFRSRYIGARRLALLGGSINLDALPGEVEEDSEGSLEVEIEPAMAAGGH